MARLTNLCGRWFSCFNSRHVSTLHLTGFRLRHLLHPMHPVLNDSYQILAEVVQRREEKRYLWLKQLLLLATGTLSVLVSFRAGTTHTHTAHVFLSVGLASLGLGILFGSISLYGEVRMAHDAVEQTARELRRRLSNPETPAEPIFAKRPVFYAIAQGCCYTVLVVAMISLVTYAICS